MPIYPPRPAPFICAICCKDRPLDRWQWAGDYPIPPVCRSCAQTWGTGIGGQGDRNRDRRTIRLVSALAEALRCEAHRAERKERRHHA